MGQKKNWVKEAWSRNIVVKEKFWVQQFMELKNLSLKMLAKKIEPFWIPKGEICFEQMLRGQMSKTPCVILFMRI